MRSHFKIHARAPPAPPPSPERFLMPVKELPRFTSPFLVIVQVRFRLVGKHVSETLTATECNIIMNPS